MNNLNSSLFLCFLCRLIAAAVCIHSDNVNWHWLLSLEHKYAKTCIIIIIIIIIIIKYTV
jgi:hypothetical protein